MSAAVQLRTGGGSAAAHSQASSLSTASLAWTAPVIDVEDLAHNAAKHAPARNALASVAVQLRGARRTATSPVQTRLGFRAYADHLILLTAERQLAQRSDGKLTPTSEWQITEVRQIKAVATATRRGGTFEAGRLSGPGSGHAGETVAREAEAAAHAEQYLPPEVRQGLVASVPRPLVHLGELVQLTGVGKPPEQHVVVLRADDRQAVLVCATRPDRADASWISTEWRWTLDGGGRAISAATRQAIRAR